MNDEVKVPNATQASQTSGITNRLDFCSAICLQEMKKEQIIAIQEYEAGCVFFVTSQVYSSWQNKMPHCLLRSIISITDVFHKHAKSDGHCQRLTKTELKKLLQQEFGNILEVRTITLLPCILWYLGQSSWLGGTTLLLVLLPLQLFLLRVISSSSSSARHLRADVSWEFLLTLCVLTGN